jgi:hypothetical protein
LAANNNFVGFWSSGQKCSYIWQFLWAAKNIMPFSAAKLRPSKNAHYFHWLSLELLEIKLVSAVRVVGPQEVQN